MILTLFVGMVVIENNSQNENNNKYEESKHSIEKVLILTYLSKMLINVLIVSFRLRIPVKRHLYVGPSGQHVSKPNIRYFQIKPLIIK